MYTALLTIHYLQYFTYGALRLQLTILYISYQKAFCQMMFVLLFFLFIHIFILSLSFPVFIQFFSVVKKKDTPDRQKYTYTTSLIARRPTLP